jgi:lipopolysaccharide/colanic/teichoic acid biosynthesis glycosyltransferase
MDGCAAKRVAGRLSEQIVSIPRATNGSDFTPSKLSPGDRKALDELTFKKCLSLERKRTERSGKPFLLMLMEMEELQNCQESQKIFRNVIAALLSATRETDLVGWYKEYGSLGVVFTDLIGFDKSSLLSTMLTRVSAILRDNLSFEQFNQISISFHVFPDKWDGGVNQRPRNRTLYPDLSGNDGLMKLHTISKRLIDIGGSALLLLLFLPLFLVVALAIKSTSKGPVLFRQQRIGQYGRSFTFLKFRSMQVNNDHSVHREYVTKLIGGEAVKHAIADASEGDSVFKLTRDSRITPLGMLLRRSSVDELPQLINVLRGDMSLVGPRPAIPYEVAAYQTWHRRRVFEVKPGITGLWQVNGRSRLTFDEMVRLDLRYAKTCSPWLDIKIMLQTPRAVLSGDGAF